MRRKLKAVSLLGTVGLGAGVLLVALAPFLVSGPVMVEVGDWISEEVDADVTLGPGEVRLWRSFPNATLYLEDVRVVNRAPFAGTELAVIPQISVTVDIASALGDGPIRVVGLEMVDAAFDVRVADDGSTNTDILPATEEAETEESGGSLWLRDVAISGLDLHYEDATTDLLVDMVDLDLSGDAELEDTVLASRTEASMASLSVASEGLTLLKEAKLESKLDVRYAPETGAIQFGESKISLNALALDLSGDITPADGGTELNLVLETEEASFKSLLSLVPSAYSSDFDGVDANGTLGLSGRVSGLLPDEGDHLPSYRFLLSVADGHFKYPDLPMGIDDIQLGARFEHPGGDPDRALIDIERFAMKVDGAPFSGRLRLTTPVSDPEIDTRLEGRLDLGKLYQAFPEDGTSTTGTLDLDVALAGKTSAFEAVDVDAVTAEGSVMLTDVVYTDPEQPLPFHIHQLELGLDPRTLDLARFELSFGDSDIKAKGAVENALGYLLADQTLRGRFDLSSRYIDTRPWETDEEEETAAADGESSLVVVPDDLDVALNLDFGRVKTQDYDLNKVRGQAAIQEGAIRLTRLRGETLGGQIEFNGTYTAASEQEAELDMDVTARELVIGETVATFASLSEALPIAQGSKGRIETTVKLKTALGPDLSPNLVTMLAQGSFGAKNTTFDPSFLAPVAAFTGIASHKTLSLDPVQTSFTVDGGRLHFDALPVTMGQAKGTLSGSSGMEDDSLALTLDLSMPAAAITGGGAQALGGAIGDVGITATIGGTWEKPEVKVKLSQSVAEAVKDVVVDLVEEQLGASLDDLIAAAEAQGDKLVAEAGKAGDVLRAEADKAADKLVAEAKKQGKKLRKEAKGNPLKEVAADKAADELLKQAKKKAKKLRKTADDKANKLESTAKDKRTALIDEAKKKAQAGG